jgi:S1-C subfamily serine protease
VHGTLGRKKLPEPTGNQGQLAAGDQAPGLRPGRILGILRRFKAAGLFSLGVLAALGAMLAYRAIFPPPAVPDQASIERTVAEAMSSATPPPALSSYVYSVIRPSLVLIQTKSEEDEGLGSGVIISDAGAILTSLHVVDGAESIEVTFADGTTAEATVTARQPDNDIAVIQPNSLPDPLVPAVLGNPGALREGDEAFVLGNPLGLYSSLSAGVISGFDRAFKPESTDHVLRGLIQVDAAVNPGNSGGPLLNRYGEVVGIVTGIANPTKQPVFIGIGFAVPITVAARAAGSLPY